MLDQRQQAIPVEPNWSSSWWSSGSGASTWSNTWSGSVWAADDRSELIDGSDRGPDDEVRVEVFGKSGSDRPKNKRDRKQDERARRAAERSGGTLLSEGEHDV